MLDKTPDPLALFEKRVRAREEGGQTGVSRKPPPTTSLRETTVDMVARRTGAPALTAEVNSSGDWMPGFSLALH